jgi:hypothetical protein
MAQALDKAPARYELYGIAVLKQTVYGRGGRPVIYAPAETCDQLPQVLQHLFVRFEPPDVDFTWEREWRIRADEFSINPEVAAVFVRTAAEAFEIMSEFAEPNGEKRVPTWSAVALSPLVTR